MDKHIIELEEDLGIETGEYDSGNNISSNIGGLFSMVGQVVQGMGIKPPEGAQMPDANLIGESIGKVFNNPETTGAIGNIFKDIQNCTDVGEVLTKLTTGFSDVKFTKAIGDTLNNNANNNKVNNSSNPASSSASSTEIEQKTSEDVFYEKEEES